MHRIALAVRSCGPDSVGVSIQLRRSPGTTRQIAEMLAAVNTIIGDVELVTIGRKGLAGYNDTGLIIDVDHSRETIRPEELVSAVVQACKEDAAENGDAWYQATFLSAERPITTGKGKNATTTNARATLAQKAFPIGEADSSASARTVAKAQIESEAAVAIRTISDFASNTLVRLGDQVVQMAGATKDLIVAQVETQRQVAAQQKGYVTQGETLVELVKLQHSHALAMAEAEANKEHTDAVLSFAKQFGMEWAKANLFTNAGSAKASPGFKPDPAKPDAVNILADVLHGLSDEKMAQLVELLGQDVMDYFTAASQVGTIDEFKAILVRVRDTWVDKDMREIGIGIGKIIGPEAFAKLYTALVEGGLAE